MRRILTATLAGAVFLAPAGVAFAAPVAPGTPAGSIGIKLVDAPTDLRNDPRAHSYIIDHVNPGTSISRRVEVDNNTDSTQQVAVYAAGAKVTGGAFTFDDGRTQDELTTWTTVTPTTLSVAAHTSQLTRVTIAVPPRASEGERYGVVWAETRSATRPGSVAAVNRVGVRIYLSVGPGGDPPTKFTIAGLAAGRGGDGRPFVRAKVTNSGGRTIDLSGTVTLTGGPGGISAAPAPVTTGTTLASGQTGDVVAQLDRSLPAGPWRATLRLTSGLATATATGTLTFPATGVVSGKLASSSGSGWVMPVVIAAAVLLLLVLIVVILRRRRGGPGPRGRAGQGGQAPVPG